MNELKQKIYLDKWIAAVKDDEIHVFPNFRKERLHRPEIICWCKPKLYNEKELLDEIDIKPVYIHTQEDVN